MTDLQLTLYLNKLLAVALTTMLVMALVATIGFAVLACFVRWQEVKRNKR